MANQKLRAPSRIPNLTSLNQREQILNSLISSLFSYCPLILMFTSTGCNKKIHRIHERSLRLIHSDYISSLRMIDAWNFA